MYIEITQEELDLINKTNEENLLRWKQQEETTKYVSDLENDQ